MLDTTDEEDECEDTTKNGIRVLLLKNIMCNNVKVFICVQHHGWIA
jgi:hypothetical protein